MLCGRCRQCAGRFLAELEFVVTMHVLLTRFDVSHTQPTPVFLLRCLSSTFHCISGAFQLLSFKHSVALPTRFDARPPARLVQPTNQPTAFGTTRTRSTDRRLPPYCLLPGMLGSACNEKENMQVFIRQGSSSFLVPRANRRLFLRQLKLADPAYTPDLLAGEALPLSCVSTALRGSAFVLYFHCTS